MSDSAINIYDKQHVGQHISIETDVEIAQNEPMINHVLNRPIKTLLQNDLQLNQLYKSVFNQLNIADYSPTHSYNAGDLVWYQDQNKKLYLLKSLTNNNRNPPFSVGVDNDLEENGWEDENKYLTILDFGIAGMLSSQVQADIMSHQLDEDMHPLGKVSLDSANENYVGTKLLKSDLTNIDQRRDMTFFPQEVLKLEIGNVIIHGYCRKFGKIMEYDIIFKLATDAMSDSRMLFESTQTLSANNTQFYTYNSYSTANVNYQNNTKYFQNTQSMEIFTNGEISSIGESTKGMLVQVNRNDYTNTYAATLNFPYPFIDRNYMVFANSTLSQTNGTCNEVGQVAMVPSANDITFCNKTRQSITVLDITFPDCTQYLNKGHNAASNGLVANTFQCKIIGVTGV